VHHIGLIQAGSGRMWERASKRARLTTNIESRGSFEDDARFHPCSRAAVDSLGDQIEH
jgi:hypothetical protein